MAESVKSYIKGNTHRRSLRGVCVPVIHRKHHHHHHHHHRRRHCHLRPIIPSFVSLSPAISKKRFSGFFFSPSLQRTWCASAFVFNFSDWWNQTTSGFVLVDLVSHVGVHGLDLNVPLVGVLWFICKPFLFCGGQGST